MNPPDVVLPELGYLAALGGSRDGRGSDRRNLNGPRCGRQGGRCDLRRPQTVGSGIVDAPEGNQGPVGVVLAGATRRLSAVRWGVVGNIVTAWVLTLPGAGLIAALSYWILHAIIRA